MKKIAIKSASKYIGLNTANGFTSWEFKAEPPYPKNKGDLFHFAVSLLRIEDENKKIDFHQDDDLGFVVRYEPSGCTLGHIKSYIHSQNHKKNTSFFLCGILVSV